MERVMKQGLICLALVLTSPLALAQEAPAAPTAKAPAEPAPAVTPAEAPAEPAPAVTPAEAPMAPAASGTDGAAAALDGPKKVKKVKPPHIRPWWSWAGIGVGLTLSTLSALTAAAGVGVQALALYFWIQQATPPAGAKQAERQALTDRARNTQWLALGMFLPGVAAFFGGLILATYAFGYGNPDPKTAKDF